MDFRKSESGNILVLTAMSLTVIAGFAGMALDVGLAYRTRQKVQTAADAGAVAAALSYYNAGSGTGAAYTAVQMNGYPGTSTDVAVTHPVSFGGGSGYTQVTVTEPNATEFMRVFGFNSLNVSATAVAGPALLGSNCVNFTGTTGDDIDFRASTRFYADCGVYAASNVKVQGCGGIGKTTATYIAMAGTLSGNSSCPGSPNFVQHAGTSTNPWGTNDLTGPSLPAGCTSTFPASGTLPITITSANVSTYNGPSTGGVVCFTSPVTLGGGGGDTFALQGGGTAAAVVYVFEDGVTLANNTSVKFGDGTSSGTGTSTTYTLNSGAMMEITGTCSTCGFNSAGTNFSNSTLTIYAPNVSGTPYQEGIAIFQPYTDTNQLNLQFGSSTLNLDGYIYAPGAALDLQDQGGGVLASGIVANSLTSDSNANITISYGAANPDWTLNRVVALVE
jgi:Flp pilus assembly protein TadG